MSTHKHDINLYSFVPQDRSGRVCWYLEELGLPYRRTTLDPSKGENMTATYLALHPLGRVPTLEIDGEVLIESAAICQILEEQFGNGGFAPPPGASSRAEYLRWISLCTSHLDPIGFGISQLDRHQGEARKNRLTELAEDFAPVAAMIEKAIEHPGPFLVGNKFTIADILVGQNLYWIEDVLLTPYVKLQNYLAGLKKRSAAVRSGVFKDT